jgi:hypothetical protein
VVGFVRSLSFYCIDASYLIFYESVQIAAKTNLAISSTEYCCCLFDEGQIMGKYQQKSVWSFVHNILMVGFRESLITRVSRKAMAYLNCRRGRITNVSTINVLARLFLNIINYVKSVAIVIFSFTISLLFDKCNIRTGLGGGCGHGMILLLQTAPNSFDRSIHDCFYSSDSLNASSTAFSSFRLFPASWWASKVSSPNDWCTS